MNRLEKSVQESLAAGRKQLVAYIVAGDPAPDWTVVAMHGLVEAGVDVIELGVPFTDPEAEGPVIQGARACINARDNAEKNARNGAEISGA